MSEKKIEKEEEITYKTPRAKEAHPAHQGQGGLLPLPAAPSCSVECHRASRAAATPPACLEPLPWPLLTPGDAALPSTSIPPSTDTLLVSLAVFVDVRELTGVHRRGTPWPPSSSAAATLSRTRAVVVFIAVCKQSTPGAPSTSSSSPSRRWTRKSSSSIPPQPQLLRLPRVRLCNRSEEHTSE